MCIHTFSVTYSGILAVQQAVEVRFSFVKCHSDMETTYREYEEWSTEDIEPETKQTYEKAKKKLEKLMPFENELVC